MTNYQKELLKELQKVIDNIELECEMDDDFNVDVVSKLGVFTKSLDEIEINF